MNLIELMHHVKSRGISFSYTEGDKYVRYKSKRYVTKAMHAGICKHSGALTDMLLQTTPVTSEVDALLAELASRNIVLSIDSNGGLQARHKGDLTPDIKAAINEHCTTLLQMLINAKKGVAD